MLEWAFRRWFIDELIRALRAAEQPRRPGFKESPVTVPLLGGQQSRGGLIWTPRQAELMPRPGSALITTDLQGRPYALGDGRRAVPGGGYARGTALAHPGLPGAGPTPPAAPRLYADFPIAPSAPEFAPQRAFAGLTGWFADGALPLDADGEAPVPPAFPVNARPDGAYAVKWPQPAAYGAGLGLLPFCERQQFFYDAPKGGWATYGIFPTSDHVLGWSVSGNDWQWQWAYAASLARPNVLWPYMAGIDNGAWYMRVPKAVASSMLNSFTYLHGFPEWTFPPNPFNLTVLYVGQDFDPISEKPFPYVPGALPEPLSSPIDIETWFTSSPFQACSFVEVAEDEYVVMPAFGLASAVKADALPYTKSVRTGDWVTPDAFAETEAQGLMHDVDKMAWEFGVERGLGDIKEAISALPSVQTVGTTRVYEDGSTANGEGQARIERWAIGPGPDPLYATPERRVVDRLYLIWLEHVQRTAGPRPATGTVDWNGWAPASSHFTSVDGVNSHAGSALQVRYLDWGLCHQDYRVIIRRVTEVFNSWREAHLELVVQRRNHGGDFIAESGLTNWGVAWQRYPFGNDSSDHALFFRMALEGAEEPGWWSRYTAEEVYEGIPYVYYGDHSPAHPQHTIEPSYFMRPNRDQFYGPYCSIASAAIYGPYAWYTSDPALPRAGRWVDLYDDPHGWGGASRPDQKYPNKPVRVAYDFNRAGIWYDVMNLGHFGYRNAYTTDEQYSLDEQDGSGEVQVVIDNLGMPFFDLQATQGDPINDPAIVNGLDYAQIRDVIERFANGANLYEGPFGTLPAPHASTSRIETFCGLTFDSGDAFAVDVVVHPDGGYLALAVNLVWEYRISRGLPNGAGVDWEQVATGPISDLLAQDDAGLLRSDSAPVQEYAFAREHWPTPLGRLRSGKQTLTFRALGRSEAPIGWPHVALVRLTGSE